MEKIEKIIDNLDPLNIMVILNAIYFNDEWNEKFNKDQTSLKLFYLSNN